MFRMIKDIKKAIRTINKLDSRLRALENEMQLLRQTNDTLLAQSEAMKGLYQELDEYKSLINIVKQIPIIQMEAQS